ncbi:UDP-glucose/GDP-mannose dehydrogenase family protein [bacterium]|nr:UDP-glucose/GDP-mannose dehydrogenase family protein [bacterium]
MNICVIGTGYVGLVAGACLADVGNTVICVDNDINKVNRLKNAIVEIYEPNLEEMVKNNVAENRLIFTDDVDYAVKNSLVCFIAVGTPEGENGDADLSNVYSVVKSIAGSMNGYKVIVDKSTVPVGTAEKVSQIIKENTTFDFDVVSNPEFLKQGNAVQDFLSPDRVIIGSDSDKAIGIMKEIYYSFIKTTDRILVMDIKSAEMTKYAANSFLATKISFINEIANLCEKVGANVESVRLGLVADNRIGSKFLFPGIGYGGSCFPKDVKALIETGKKYNCDMNIINAVNTTNQNQIKLFADKILREFNYDIKAKTIGIWGLAFKPKTNDMREAPSIKLINILLENGAKVRAYDPKAMDYAKRIFGDKIEYANSSYETLNDCDAMVLLTEWNEFRTPDFKRIKSLLRHPLIFDGRNQYNPKILKDEGFKYICIGKPH